MAGLLKNVKRCIDANVLKDHESNEERGKTDERKASFSFEMIGTNMRLSFQMLRSKLYSSYAVRGKDWFPDSSYCCCL